MTDRDAMMQAICADPRCDTPRLVFADYLEESGEEDRSSFIRVQVEFARIPYCSSCAPGEGTVTDYDCGHDDERAKLRRRGRELLKLCWTPYFQHLFPKPHGIEVGTLTMRWGGRIEAEPDRGFISSLTCTWADWLRHSPALFWHEKQTVECPDCGGDGSHRGGSRMSPLTINCTYCFNGKQSTGRILKPFPPTAQPLECCVLHGDTQGRQSGSTIILFGDNDGKRYEFTRATCRTCGGTGTWEGGDPPYVTQCPTCKGRPLNKWYCDEWPKLLFSFPAVSGG